MARVVRPATTLTTGGGSGAVSVLRASGDGLAFSNGQGRSFRFGPDTAPARRDRHSILINVRKGSILFGDLLPPAGAAVRRLSGSAAADLPPGYAPSDGDSLFLDFEKPGADQAKLLGYLEDAADRYQKEALARLQSLGEKPVSGTLTLGAKWSASEPPIMVSFLVDGQVRAFLNTQPYRVGLDTREWTDGEHVVEVRAHDGKGAVISKARRLVVVRNKAQ